MNETPFRQAKHFHAGRQGVAVDLIGMHSTEGSELPNAAEATQAYFTTIDRPASAHCAVDQDSVAYCVHHADTAFGAAHANNRGYHIEQCGKAGQSGAQWDDAASHATILNAARVCAAVIRTYPNIRPVWLTADDLKAGNANGITSHANIEAAWPSSGHWDPGPNYPHEKLIAAVKAELGLGDEDMTPAESAELHAVKAQADEVRTRVDALAGSVRTVEGNALARYNDLAARIDKVSGGAVDYDKLATAVADKLAARLQS